jgi:hypothetical protein
VNLRRRRKKQSANSNLPWNQVELTKSRLRQRTPELETRRWLPSSTVYWTLANVFENEEKVRLDCQNKRSRQNLRRNLKIYCRARPWVMQSILYSGCQVCILYFSSFPENSRRKGINIHQDTPTEILHTVLLGVVKYFWAQTVFLLGRDKTLALFQTCLGSIDINGLHASCLNADYICAYKGGLIGKHFKSLAQVMPFLIYDLVPKSVLNGWHAIGELVVLRWHTSIEDREVYLVRIISYLQEFWLILSQANLSRVIDNFLTITAQCAPSILISKPKFHFLLHLPAYICRFGPAILFSTE